MTTYARPKFDRCRALFAEAGVLVKRARELAECCRARLAAGDRAGWVAEFNAFCQRWQRLCEAAPVAQAEGLEALASGGEAEQPEDKFILAAMREQAEAMVEEVAELASMLGVDYP